MLAYFLKVNVAIALFYAFYRLFFYKDTFFGWRRMALLCFFVLSAAVPLLNIQTWIVAQEPMVAIADLYANTVLPEFTIAPEIGINWTSTMLNSISILYWGGVGILFIHFLSQLIGIIRLSCQCRTLKIGNINVHLLPNAQGPFSFFQWIFINPSIHNEQELDEILTHEFTHASQWHSLDIIVSEIACILCWFNPFAWLMKREIRTNLEYMADASVLANGYDSKAYQYHLLGLSHHKAAATIYNNFNVLPLKKRIKMMNKKRTREIGRTKYLMFLPLAALLMIISNIEAVARTTKEIALEVIEAVDTPIAKSTVATETLDIQSAELSLTITNPKDTIIPTPEDVVFEVVEVMPEFPNGGMPGLMKYLGKNVKYPIEAHANNIEGRVVVHFIVNKDGSISNVGLTRSVDPLLDKEAIRVISSMPKWKPGMQRGKAVRVKYTVPVMFRLQGPKNAEPYQAVVGTAKDGNLEEVVAVAKATTPISRTEGKVYEKVENMPEFPGGVQGLMQYISSNLKYPAAAQKAGIQGKVIVSMIVDKEGNITDPKIIKGITPLLDAEAIRIISDMPQWKPGTDKGEKVNVQYTIPLVFKLQ
ncbi:MULTISPECIES: M56 family metallopeptidase [Bacteroides]|uniref:M56 family metallopeptidase n=1 Tax=Bacteroides TaxID=816 RepID=UPI000E438BEA|nr:MULTISPECIES: M56 family metallopeptidase [Bacteroides]RGM48063.1 M56 family peptidase [Bacteroides sp. OM08-11]